MPRLSILVLAAAAALAAFAPGARADWAVLRNGQRFHITGYERSGSSLILRIKGGVIALPAAAVLRFEPEDVFPAAVSVPAASSAAAPYGEIVANAARTNGLNRRLLTSVIRAESDFQPRARSPRGALGLMQIMPATARSLAVRNPLDPAENVQAGARYLKSLLCRFPDERLALAAYNAGPGAVSDYGGIPPFPETRAYVARVSRDMKKQPVVPDSRSGVVKLVCSPLATHCRQEAATPAEAARLPRP